MSNYWQDNSVNHFHQHHHQEDQQHRHLRSFSGSSIVIIRSSNIIVIFGSSNSNSNIIVIRSIIMARFARFAITINWVRTVSNCELIAVLWFMRWPMPDSNRASRLLATVGALWSELNCCPKLLPASPSPPHHYLAPKSFIVMNLLQTTKADFRHCVFCSSINLSRCPTLSFKVLELWCVVFCCVW